MVTLGMGLLFGKAKDRLEDPRDWGSFTLGRVGGLPLALSHRRPGTFELELLLRVLPSQSGVRTVVGLGAAGALDRRLEPGDLLVPTRAGRGEGLSRYYLPPGATVRAEARLVSRLKRAAGAAGARCWSGPVFTTGALLRETPGRVARWRRAGFLAVECEAAALLALCRFCGLAGAVLLLITDSPARGFLPRDEADWEAIRHGADRAVDAVLSVAAEAGRGGG
ncbi:MAG: hypothetical protein K6T75_05115 [Acetobacteraceae bacterium]|nr:hypothetical protein [Acetobacteraceae bacterium]